MNDDDLKTIMHRYNESIDSVEQGCIHTATGLIKKIDWVKNDTMLIEAPKIELVKKLTLWQRIKQRFFEFRII